MIIIDTNVLIYGEMKDSQEYLDAIRRYRAAIESDRIGINVIIVSEFFHKISKLVDSQHAATKISEIFESQYIDYLEFNPELIARAAKLSRDFKLRINDALIAQQAIELGAAILTDNVKDFGKINSLKIIPMRAK